MITAKGFLKNHKTGKNYFCTHMKIASIRKNIKKYYADNMKTISIIYFHLNMCYLDQRPQNKIGSYTDFWSYCVYTSFPMKGY